MNHTKSWVIGLSGAAILSASGVKAATLHDGAYDGGTYDAYFGPVQVEIMIKGGKVVSSKALQWPSHRRTSVSINNSALPILEREVVKTQNANVHTVSGATLTCEAYASSLADAFNQASK